MSPCISWRSNSLLGIDPPWYPCYRSLKMWLAPRESRFGANLVHKYLEAVIPEAIDYSWVKHPLRPFFSQISYRARLKMFARFQELCKPSESDRIVDVGVTPESTLPESNFFEMLYPHPEMLTVTSIEDASCLEQMYPGIKFIQTAADRLPFKDKEFDIAVSFAVLEHVGSRENQKRFVHEMVRVARRVFLTTPDRGFPIEVHTFLPFLHWLDQPLHQRILKMVGAEFFSKTENLNLLWDKELLAMFPDTVHVELHHNRLLGMSSNLLAHAWDGSD